MERGLEGWTNGCVGVRNDELMLEYMGNEGVGSEEIDMFMGWSGGRQWICETRRWEDL